MNVTGDLDRPLAVAVAVSLLVPATVPTVQVTDACPWASVVADVAERLPPPAVTANVTVAPAKPGPLAVVTLTTSGWGRSWPTVPVWLLPETRAIADGLGGGLVDSLPPQPTRTIRAPNGILDRMR
jgi:hypothetical protein